jgi:lysophospholipase L1-like esterase
MRRALQWYVPIGVALIASAVFAAGFYSFVTGDTGEPVASAPSRLSAATIQPSRGQIVTLVIGDSLARGTGDESGLGIGGRLVEDLRKSRSNVKPPINIAVNGARTRDVEEQLKSHNVQVLIAQSNVIVVSIGGNDLWGGTDWRAVALRDPNAFMGDVLQHVTNVVTTIRAANPTARIFLVGLYNPFVSAPFVNRWNAEVTDRFANDANFTLVETSDLFSHRDRLSFDRFHPNDEGYALIARRIADSL